MSKTTAPLLPEATFKPLASARLEAMIDTALAHPQDAASPRTNNIISFARRRTLHNMAFGSGIATMAASIMLAFMLTPQVTTTTLAATSEISVSADVTDMILYESFGA